MPEKGLNRGGAKGQKSDLGEREQADLERPGWQQEQGNLPQKGTQRGGLQREPDLSRREEETGHEVD